MALEQYYFQDPSTQTLPTSEPKPPQNSALKSFPDDESDAVSSPAGFECNICLDSVHDPVVTLCGHLFCWPCIYKWLHFQTANHQDPHQPPQCPVCKAEVSQASLVPLYGPGQPTRPSKSAKQGAPALGIVVPRRPPFCGSLDTFSPRTPPTPARAYNATAPTPGRGIATNLMDPTSIGVYGEMVYARVFGNSITNLYTYPNSYNLAGNGSPRVRRHVMQADESLSRIWFFLVCCALLCLVLF